MFLKVSWLFFGFGFLMPLQAQERLNIHFNARSGLPGNKVYSVNQDIKGYIWMSTDRGAVRWNGFEFKRYSIEDSLPDNEVLHTFDDSKGRIWVMCFNNIPGCLERGLVNHREVEALKGRFSSAGIYNYSFLNHKNQYWLSFRNDSGVFLLTRAGNAERYRIQMPLLVESLNIIDVVKSDVSTVDIYMPGRLLQLKKGTQKPEVYTISLPGESGTPVFLKRPNFYFKGHYYAVTKEGKMLEYGFVNHRPVCYRYVTIPLEVRSYLIRDGRAFLYDDKGRLYDVERGVFESGYEFLADKQVNELFYDRQGNLWVSTLNNGVYLYPARSLLLSTPDFIRDGISHVRFRNYHVFGTEYNGLYVMDARFRVLMHAPEIFRPVKLELAGDYCVIASDKGLIILDTLLRTRQCGDIRILKDIYHYREDIFYAANFSGAYRISLNSGIGDTLFRSRATAVWGDHSGVVWVGTMQGLYKLTKGRQAKVKLHPTLDESRITDIAGDQQGRVFVATHNHGLFILMGSKVLHCAPNNKDMLSNLPDKQIIRLLADGNNLWVLSQAGLGLLSFHGWEIRPRSNQFLGPMNGLVAGIFYDINKSDQPGIPELLTDQGLVLINNIKNLDEPELQAEIEGVSHRGMMLTSERLQHLGNNENELTFHLNAIAVLSGPGLAYEYRIPALDTQWVITKANLVHFSELQPGAYLFEARVRSAYAVSKTVSVRFYIRPAWYQIPVVRFSLFLAALVGLAWIVVLLIRRAARKMQLANLESQKLAQLELKVLRSRMNPHFVFNVLTSIQNFITQGREQEANYYTSQFAQLIRQTFHGSASNFVSLAEELQLLNGYLDLERMRFGNRLDYSIEVDEQLIPEEFSIPSLLVQPFLENAINHGIRNLNNGKGMLFVRFKIQKHNRLIIEIEDNGVGIKAMQAKEHRDGKARKHKSEGMKLAKDRIELMNRSYHLDMALMVHDLTDLGRQGTLVLIDLPIQFTSELKNYKH